MDHRNILSNNFVHEYTHKYGHNMLVCRVGKCFGRHYAEGHNGTFLKETWRQTKTENDSDKVIKKTNLNEICNMLCAN